MALLIVAALAFLTLWVVAVSDVIRATEMEPLGRGILAAVVILTGPLGLVVWLVVRQGRAGVLLATALGAATAAILIGIAVVGSRGPSLQNFRVQQGFSVQHVVAPGSQSIP
jgi:hypothetical protein